MNEQLALWQIRLVALATAEAGSDGAHDITHLNSNEITSANWARRPAGERLKQWFARMAAYWL